MIDAIARILLRYSAVPIALWLGLPEEVVAEIVNDPNVLVVVTVTLAAVAAAVESWWLRSRRK